MLFPYRDINPTRRFPLVTVLIIAANIGFFLYPLMNNLDFDFFSRQFALIPSELFKGNLPDSQWISPYLTLVTYMFVHGGLGHLAFNMLFLWIFGNNIEDAMTRPRFLAFYLLIGVISAVAFLVYTPVSDIPLVGASGAISGVLGAYMILYPFAKVHAIFIIFPVRMPAIFFLVVWFLSQVSGLLSGQASIAWVAHISGFISGMALFRLFIRYDARPPRRDEGPTEKF